MKNPKQIFSAFLLGAALFAGAGFALAWSSGDYSNADQVTTSDTLTATKWNKMVDTLKDLTENTSIGSGTLCKKDGSVCLGDDTSGSSGGGTIFYKYSDYFTITCDATTHSDGYVGCPDGTYVVSCAREYQNANPHDWVFDGDGKTTLGWYNLSLIPPSAIETGNYANGGCRIGYACNSGDFLQGTTNRIRAICVPATNISQ